MPQTPPFSAMFDSSGYNRNVYQPSEDSCGGLNYHDNNLLSGSLEALIQHLVPNVDYYPDVGILVPLKPTNVWITSCSALHRDPASAVQLPRSLRVFSKKKIRSDY